MIRSTLPNLFLTLCASSSLLSGELEGDIELSPELCERFVIDLARRNIHICAISGAWGAELVELVPRLYGSEHAKPTTIVIASETIYALSTLLPFTKTLLSTLRIAKDHGSTEALIAAKDVYFGVGGGVHEFIRVLRDQGGQYQIRWKTDGEGVGRVIMSVIL